ncbi:MAG: deoxyribose-phosphate aldolase [Planctomycetota bacterium]|nr:deoxyribose-phosphate aldolase [Planctomycetota bacterium]
MTPQQLAAMIDHTLLRPEVTCPQIDRLCAQALKHGFCAVCVNPVYVSQAARRLTGSPVVVASVAGFPLGANTTAAKIEDARQAIDAGAREIDMVLQLGALIAGEKNRVRDDIAAVADVVHAASPDHVLKVILETAALSPELIALGCRCCAEAQVDFIKTSSGFHPAGGATEQAVATLKKLATPIKIKAAGGIGDLKTALSMIEAGADRLGMSASVDVILACEALSSRR